MTKLTQTDIRKRLNKLKRAGDIIIFIPVDQPINHLRSKIKQSAALNQMTVQIRTIFGEVHVRRTDFPNILPGTTPTAADLLWSMYPWADDPYAQMKALVLEEALHNITGE